MFRYPITITIDTNIFEAEKYDLSDNSKLQVLLKHVKEGSQNNMSQTDSINPLQMPIRLSAEADPKEIDEEGSFLNAIRENIDYEFVMTSGDAESREF